jgi:TrmH family RNA methyltransferase
MNDDQPVEAVRRVLARVRKLARPEVRRREGCFWVEGVKHFVQAVDARFEFEAVVYSRILLNSDTAEMFSRRLSASGVPRIKVTPEQFRSVSGTVRASGIGAIVRERWTPLEQAAAERGLCWLVFEQMRSPGNLGSILRTAQACGASGAIFVGDRCDPFDPDVVRASMGGLFHLPMVRTMHAELGRWATSRGVQVVGLSPEAETLWSEFATAQAVAVVVGEEREGLSPRLRGLCDTFVRLPMTGGADSINVSVAAGVMLYELVRRSNGL